MPKPLDIRDYGKTIGYIAGALEKRERESPTILE